MTTLDTLKLLLEWIFGGFAAFIVLHTIPSWPSRAWFGWLCAILCGPAVWLMLALWWMLEPNSQKPPKNSQKAEREGS